MKAEFRSLSQDRAPWRTSLSDCRDGRKRYVTESLSGTSRDVVELPGPWLHCRALSGGLPEDWPMEELVPVELIREGTAAVKCQVILREDLDEVGWMEVLVYSADFNSREPGE